ncbi:MAG: S-methyl-5-thioribose-1-phosphate isomerase [Bacillota bacterium]
MTVTAGGGAPARPVEGAGDRGGARGRVQALALGEEEVVFLDQTKLPAAVEYVRAVSVEDVARAIETMVVRGAPAIGIAGAFGLALYAARSDAATPEDFLRGFEDAARRLARTRPTAVNLFWAIERMRVVARETLAGTTAAPGRAWLEEVRRRLRAEALEIAGADERGNRRLSTYGQALLPRKCRVLTHCNAGALATGGYGTALGIIRAAREAGKEVSVLVDETRPLWQGARLTAWELMQEGIPATLITDSMAGWFMSRGEVDVVIFGADRIAANGDVANKIGSYSLAVLARAHGLPCYSAAPLSTVDLDTKTGADIVIEERSPEEVTRPYGLLVAPPGVAAANPAFDVTPARLITAIVTDAGVAWPPYERSLRELAERASGRREGAAFRRG